MTQQETSNATWKIAQEILAEMQDKYKLAYCGIPTLDEAKKIVKENNGFVFLKNSGASYHEPIWDEHVGLFNTPDGAKAGNVTLVYGTSPVFTYQHYVTFCREFYYKLIRHIMLKNRSKIELVENNFPKVFELKFEGAKRLPSNAKARTLKPQLNGQEQFQLF